MLYFFEALRKYADFKGRARRSEYWYYTLMNMIVITLLIQLIMLADPYGYGFTTPIVMVIYYLATLVPTLAVAVRRMHDVGKSGWYMFIPFYNIILALTPGDRGANRYGDDPK